MAMNGCDPAEPGWWLRGEPRDAVRHRFESCCPAVLTAAVTARSIDATILRRTNLPQMPGLPTGVGEARAGRVRAGQGQPGGGRPQRLIRMARERAPAYNATDPVPHPRQQSGRAPSCRIVPHAARLTGRVHIGAPRLELVPGILHLFARAHPGRVAGVVLVDAAVGDIVRAAQWIVVDA